MKKILKMSLALLLILAVLFTVLYPMSNAASGYSSKMKRIN